MSMTARAGDSKLSSVHSLIMVRGNVKGFSDADITDDCMSFPADLEFTFEETNSTLPPGPASAGEVERVRHDLIFSPHIHPDRDREMLENSSLPRHLRDEICFDRANSVKFLQSLTRGLRK